jgi:hypothetical protein
MRLCFYGNMFMFYDITVRGEGLEIAEGMRVREGIKRG